eukprot:361813-Amphidinium_carterae.1
MQKGDASGSDQAAVRNPIKKWSYVDVQEVSAKDRTGAASTTAADAAVPPPASSRFAALTKPSRSAE